MKLINSSSFKSASHSINRSITIVRLILPSIGCNYDVVKGHVRQCTYERTRDDTKGSRALSFWSITSGKGTLFVEWPSCVLRVHTSLTVRHRTRVHGPHNARFPWECGQQGWVCIRKITLDGARSLYALGLHRSTHRSLYRSSSIFARNCHRC